MLTSLASKIKFELRSIGTLNGQQVVGLDIAKLVFQLHSVDMNTGEIINMQLKRAKVLEYFANKESCLIAIEACGGAHHWACHWARELGKLGHTARLLHAKIVRPFVSGWVWYPHNAAQAEKFDWATSPSAATPTYARYWYMEQEA